MLEEKIRELYRITAELEEKYPGRRFTPDGHMVGSIGEVYAAEKYGLSLLEASSEKHDARSANGRLIQIKITQTDRVSIYSEPDYLIVMKMKHDGTIEEVYNGDFVASVREVLRRVEGSYSLVFMSSKHPGTLIATKQDNPLVIGVGEGENFIASDIPAIIQRTRRT